MSDQTESDDKPKPRERDSSGRFVSARQKADAPKIAVTGDQRTERHKRDWWDKSNILVTAGATAVIAVATVVTVLVTIHHAEIFSGQLGVMRGQLDEMKIARQPFVFFKNLSFEFEHGATPERAVIRVYPHWTNSGDNPTSRLTLSIFCNGEGHESFDYKQAGTLARILGPKQTDAGGRCEIEITKIRQNAGVIGWAHVGGKARYFNSARDQAVRITEFCQSAPIIADATGVRVGLDGVKICPTHNCADNECPAEDRH